MAAILPHVQHQHLGNTSCPSIPSCPPEACHISTELQQVGSFASAIYRLPRGETRVSVHKEFRGAAKEDTDFGDESNVARIVARVKVKRETNIPFL